jgi:AraC-like DNA-binding protein
MTDFPYIPFRATQGMNRVNVLAREWNGISVRYLEMNLGPGKSYGDISSDLTSLAIGLDQRGGYAEPRFKVDQPTPRSRYDSGFAVWVPAKHTIWGFSEGVYFAREVRLTFDANHLVNLLGDEFDHTLVQDPLIMLYDSRVTQCADLLARACIEPMDGDRLYGEGLTTAIFASLFSAWRRTNPPTRGSGLASWQLRRATEYMQAHSAEDISLAELAKIAKLSQSQFARAFRDSTGVPPYRYILRIRIQHAEKLLAKTRTPISEVAAQVGFADQSHFTKAFRRFLGATPKRWREDRQS